MYYTLKYDQVFKNVFYIKDISNKYNASCRQ